MKFKFTILTMWTLLPKSILDEECRDPNAQLFSEILSQRTELELHKCSFWPRARAEAFMENSFEFFENRFLKESEYTLFILSGQFAPYLDYIYPRLVIFFTIKPKWTERIIIVFLGQPSGPFKFDLNIFKKDPIIFEGDFTQYWKYDIDSWIKLLGLSTGKCSL